MRNLIILILCLLGCEPPIEAENMDEAAMGDEKVDLGSKTSWSAAGRLLPGNVTRTVHLQAKFREAGNYTVQLSRGPVQSSGFVAGNFIATRATVFWTVEGNSIERTISVVDGASITGAAQAVQVIVNDESDLTGGPAAQEYYVGISVVKGVRGSNKQPPFYERGPAIEIAPAASHQFSINALRLSGINSVLVTAGMIDQPGDYTDVQVQQLDSGGILKSYNLITHPDWVPLSPGANRIMVRNNVGFNIYAQVTYGIDG